jgi:CheY-like chemotaxis protein
MRETLGNRVLLVGAETTHALLPSILEHSRNSVTAEIVAAVQPALDRLAENGWDAVVCWAEREDELEAVVRIRKATPGTPILLLTSRKDAEFADLARRMGSTQVAPNNPDLKRVSETIRIALATGVLAEQLRVQAERAQTVTRDLASLAAENRALSGQARSRTRTSIRSAFVPLVVEGDLEYALLLIRAFARANIFSPLPILKGGDEAISYLSEVGRPATAPRFRLPSVILLDTVLPGKSGFEVLAWIRRQPAFKRLPVIILSSSADPVNINRSYELGANSYLVKPTSFPALVELVTGLRVFWDFNQRWDTGTKESANP